MCEEDLNAIYKSLDEDDKGNILLWYSGRCSTFLHSKIMKRRLLLQVHRKRKAAAGYLVDKHQERMDDLDDVFKKVQMIP